MLLCRQLEALDMEKDFEFTLFDALHIVWHAWEQVSELTIRSCFAKTKFTKEEYQPESDDAELLEIWEALPIKEKVHKNKKIELLDFLKAYECLMSVGSVRLEEIAKEMLHSKELMESEDDVNY